MASNSSTAAAADTTTHHHRQGGRERIPPPPPPTPSNQSLDPSFPTDVDAALSRFQNQLLTPPKALSLPLPHRRRLIPSASSKTPPPPPPPPIISLLHRPQDLLLSAARDLGFFHVTDHGIPSHLPTSALLESRSLLHSTNRSSLGFNRGDEEAAYFVFDVGSGDLDGLPELREYARCLERVGLEVVEMLSGGGTAGGFPVNPFRNGSIRPRCLVWVSSCSSVNGIEGGEEGEEMVRSGLGEMKSACPYVACLQYEMRGWRNRVHDGDSGAWIPVDPHADALLVTLGDIAQVWSNGRFSKVRGIPQPISCESSDVQNYISMSLLITLPMDTMVSPIPLSDLGGWNEDGGGDDDGGDSWKSL